MTDKKQLSYEEQIKELKQINKNQQELIVDYEEQLKYNTNTNFAKAEESTLTLLFLNKRVKCLDENNDYIMTKNLLDIIKIPCWNEKPIEFAKTFQEIYYEQEYLLFSSWYEIQEIIILGKTYKYTGYETEYLNQEYLNEKITFQYLVEKYDEIKNKYKLTGMKI